MASRFAEGVEVNKEIYHIWEVKLTSAESHALQKRAEAKGMTITYYLKWLATASETITWVNK